MHAVLWADRTTVRKSTGIAPFRLEYGYDAVLPIEMDFPTWHILEWEGVRTTGDLLSMRARQLERRDEDLKEAALHLRRLREQGKELFDDSHQLQRKPLEEGDMVLVHDSKLDTRYDLKLAFKWLEPFIIAGAHSDKGYYKLAELDGARLSGTYAGNRLKRFKKRKERATQGPSRTSNEPERVTPGNNEGISDPTTLIPRNQNFAVVIPSRT